MKFDDILEHHVGEFGPYQKRIYLLACIPAVAAAILTLQPIFTLATPEHRCRIPNLPNDTYNVQSPYHEEIINLTIPVDTKQFGMSKWSECNVYNRGNLSVSELDTWDRPDSNMSQVNCNDWVFDDSEFVTAVSQYHMVCTDSILQAHFKMISFVGCLCGSFICGILSDLFGRKKIFLICVTMYMIFTIGLLFLSPTFEVLLVMRFLQGNFGIGVFVTSFVFVVELAGPNYRLFAGIFIEIFWCLGLFVLVGGAYLIRDWVYQTVALTAPFVLLLTYYWLLPESPRWLMSRGQITKAERILQKAAKVNGTSLPEKLVEKVAEEEQERQEGENESGKAWKIFTHKILLIRFIVVAFNRYALNMAYYGISWNLEHLSGNLYLNFTASSAVETLATATILLLINRLGRKPLYCGSMMLGAAGFLIAALPIFLGDKDDLIWIIMLAMVGKAGVSAAYAVMYVFASEVFPTSLRNSAMGLFLIIETQGGILAPYLIDIGNDLGGNGGAAFPMLVFGSVSLVAALLSLFLPETRNKQLPESVKDAIAFGRLQQDL